MSYDNHNNVLLRGQVRALVAGWLAADRFRPRCDAWLRGYDAEFSQALAERGWIGLTWPVEVGGGGRSNTARLVLTEELLRAGDPALRNAGAAAPVPAADRGRRGDLLPRDERERSGL